MANPEHLAKLKEGVEAWNDFRKANRTVAPSLIGSDYVCRADINQENLWAELSGANLGEADLSGADLNWKNLNWAELSGTNLIEAKLNGANLTGAKLVWAE